MLVDEDEDLQEEVLRSISVGVLLSRIVDRSRKIHQTKDIGKKLDLVASWNTSIGALVFALSAFIKSQK